MIDAQSLRHYAGRLANTASRAWFTGLLAAAACAGAMVIQHLAASEKAAIDVDMMVSQGTMIELYLNDWRLDPQRLTVVPDQRHTYHFEHLPARLDMIRLDPTDASGARIVIYGIQVRVGDRTVQEFGPPALRNWRFENLLIGSDEAGGLVLNSTTNDPFFYTNTSVALPSAGPIRTPLADLFGNPAAIVLMVMAFLLIVAVYGVHRLRGHGGAVMDTQSLRHYAGRLADTASRAWFVGLLAVAAFAGTMVIQHLAASEKAAIDVDMMVSHGTLIELYLNDWRLDPRRLTVVPDQRHTYHFEHLPARLDMIRLDPTDASGARVVMYGIQVRVGDRTVQEFGPSALRNWRLANISIGGDEAGGLVLNSTTNDPYFYASASVVLPSASPILTCASALFGDPEAIVLLAMAFFLILAMCGIFGADGMREAALVAAVICTAPLLVAAALKLPGKAPPVRVAVGLAAYTGYPKSLDYIAGSLLLIFCLGLACLCYRFARPGRPPESTALESRPHRRVTWLAHAGVLLFLLLYFQPNLWAGLSSLKAATYGPIAWDDVNGLLWTYLPNVGLWPLRDFFFPYGGFYTQLLPFPTGPLMAVVLQVLPLWFLYLGLFHTTGRRLRHAVSLFLLVLIPVLLGHLTGSSRYLLAADVAFLYLPASSAKRFDWRIHPPFTACVAFAFFCEPTQVVNAAAGILIHLVTTLFPLEWHGTVPATVARLVPVLKQRARYGGIPMVAGILAATLVYAVNGMLPGLWSFEASIPDQLSYGAFPTNIADWVSPVLHPDSIFLVLFLLIVYATYRYLRRAQCMDDLTAALVMVCTIGFLAMQKQILRPHAMYQVGIYPYLGLLLYGSIMWRERTRMARPVIAIFAGGVLALTASTGLFRTAYQQAVVQAASNLTDNVDTLLHYKSEIRAVNASRFARGRFKAFREENAVVEVLLSECGLTPRDRVYVLGDDALFYILLGLPTPYVTNSYNTSPIYEQQRIVEWLRQQQPRFVLWNPGSAVYDKVPHAVRLPLIYNYVARHYSLLRSVGPYHILTAIPAGQSPDLGYWRRTLGDTTDLGYIPGLARLSDFTPCKERSCEPILVVRPQDSGARLSGKTGVAVQTSVGTFSIRFDVTPDSDTYVVPLRRLWFWSFVESASPQLAPVDPRLRISTERRAQASPVLY